MDEIIAVATHDSPPPAVFYRDVWGASATSVFAVGFGGMVRFDGSSWTDQTPAGPFVMLEGVWGVGPTEVYAVGTDLSFRYDGTEWLDWTAPAGSHRAIWGSGGSDIFVVGFSEVQHYDGSGWQRTVTGALVGVFGAGPDDVIAVGWSGEAIRYDGTSWESIAAGTEYDLHDVGYSAGKWRIVGLSGATLEWP